MRQPTSTLVLVFVAILATSVCSISAIAFWVAILVVSGSNEALQAFAWIFTTFAVVSGGGFYWAISRHLKRCARYAHSR